MANPPGAMLPSEVKRDGKAGGSLVRGADLRSPRFAHGQLLFPAKPSELLQGHDQLPRFEHDADAPVTETLTPLG